jgi:hypothetical protein
MRLQPGMSTPTPPRTRSLSSELRKDTCLFAALTVSAFCAASAQAELLEYLPTFPNAFKATSTGPKFTNLESSLEISCASSEGTGEVSSGITSKVTEVFKGCKAKIFGISVGGCKGAADTVAETITVKGTTSLGFKLVTALEPVAVLAVAAVTIECPGNEVVVKGNLCGVPTLAKSTTGTLTFAATGAGDQTITDYKTKESGGENKTCVLESTLNKGTPNMSAQAQVVTLKWATAVQLDD